MLKKLALALGIFISLIALAVVVFYVGWLRAPSQEAVCENMVAIQLKESTVGKELPAEVTQKMQTECIKNTKKGIFQSDLTYATQMKCLEAAPDMAALRECSKKKKR